jgi:hypothetical protein
MLGKVRLLWVWAPRALECLALVWAKPRPCGAFLGPGVSQGEPLVHSVALEPVALVLLAPLISALSAAAAAGVAAAAAAAAAAGQLASVRDNDNVVDSLAISRQCSGAMWWIVSPSLLASAHMPWRLRRLIPNSALRRQPLRIGFGVAVSPGAHRPTDRGARVGNVLGPVPGVDVVAKRPQGLLNVGTLSARMAVLRSCALDI